MKRIIASLMVILCILTCISSEMLCFAVEQVAATAESLIDIHDDNGSNDSNDSSGKISAPDENNEAETQKASDSEEFAELVTELVNENWEDTYFGEIVVDGDNSVSVDGVPTSQDIADIVENGVDEGQILSQPVDDEKGENTLSYPDLYSKGCDVEESEGKIRIRKPFQTRRLIVYPKNGILRQNFGASTVISDGKGRYVLQFETEVGAEKAYNYLKTLKNIASVSIDSVISVAAVNPLTQQGRNRWGAERIESDRYKKYLQDNNKSNTVVVAVVDTGVELEHPFLKGRLISSGYDFIRKDKLANDENMHGTHCAGIIADNTPENVKILPVKVFNSGGSSTNSIIAMGIDYAVENGADVISMSFGGNCAGDECEIDRAVSRAIKAGVVCVAAAGNEAEDTRNFCPAGIEECITVSSVDKNDMLSDFSNYGDEVDIAAPGEDIWSSSVFKNGSYESASGTSMATPFVAAASAMLLVNEPELAINEVEKKIKNTAVDLGIKGEDKSFGAGALDFGVFFDGKTKSASISIKEKEITVYKSDVIDFGHTPVSITVLPMSAQDKGYTVKIKDSSVVQYDGFGFLAKKVGETTAVFTLDNGKSVSVKVKCVRRKFWVDYAAKGFAGGEGTQSNPYLIKTAEQLARVAYLGKKYKLKTDMCFKQVADIDLKGKTWYPIFARDAEGMITRVNYDGNGYDIKNLQISNIDTDIYVFYAGLFAFNLGEMKNINLIDADINCPESNWVGGLCADFGGVMKNCYVSGKIRGSTAGGIVGTFDVITGTATHRIISNCRSDAMVWGESTGGIVWSMSNGHIENCIFTGKTYGDESGGIVKYISAFDGTTEADYGYCDLKILNCVSVENIAYETETETQGGILMYPYISNCYYSGEYENGIEGNQEKGTVVKKVLKIDADELKKVSFYTDKSRWDSSCPWNTVSTWKIKNDFPVLADQKDNTVNTQFAFHEVGNSVVVNGYYGKNPNVTVPSKINGKPVTAIGTLFTSHNVDIESLALPDTVKIISGSAFDNRVGRINKSLRKIDIGNGVEHIDAQAFVECTKLKYVVLPKTLKTLDANAFAMSSVQYAFFEGDAVNINPDAFENCNIKVYYKKGSKGWSNVKKNGVTTITYDPAKPALAVANSDKTYVKYGKKTKLDITILPESVPLKNISYAVSGNFSVDKNGYVTAKTKNKAEGMAAVRYNGERLGTTLLTTVGAGDNYTVKFNGNGATSGKMANQTLSYYIPEALSSNQFKRTGYRFLGWSTNKNGKTVHMKNKEKAYKLAKKGKTVTLYAIWVPVEYKIKFNANGGTGKMSSQAFTYGKSQKLLKNSFVAPTGKTFAGWSKKKDGSVLYTNSQSVKNLTSKNNITIELYAVWVKSGTFKITYKLYGGTLPEDYNKTYESGKGAALPVPVRKGYDFVGWYQDSKRTKKINRITTSYAKNLTLYAKWKAHKYSVRFNANGGSGKMSNQTDFYYGKAKALKECTFTAPKGKVFVGWSTKKNGEAIYKNKAKVKNLTAANGKTVTLYAVWKNKMTYNIKYKLNGGILAKDAKKSYSVGSGYILPTPSRKGYSFCGWYIDKEYKNKISAIDPWNTGNVTVYALWKKK